jgi:Txe/YoeB family toxin of Txe-Axe toxin-antitoxin module
MMFIYSVRASATDSYLPFKSETTEEKSRAMDTNNRLAHNRADDELTLVQAEYLEVIGTRA